MARDTYGTVTALIRSVVDDRDQSGGIVFSDADLLPFVNAELRDLYEILASAESRLTKQYFTSNLAATTETTIDFTTNPVTSAQFLPANFAAPLQIWEKLQGDPDRNYTLMDETAERLPDYDQTDRIRFWVYTTTAQGPAIVTLGATSARTLRVEYSALPTPLAQATDFLPYPGSASVLAYGGLLKAALSRGESELVQLAQPMHEGALQSFKRLNVKDAQRRGRRRTGYGQMRTYRW